MGNRKKDSREERTTEKQMKNRSLETEMVRKNKKIRKKNEEEEG